MSKQEIISLFKQEYPQKYLLNYLSLAASLTRGLGAPLIDDLGLGRTAGLSFELFLLEGG